MALKFNTFRPDRYLRTRFVEGKFLLASEATDIELEIIDQLRETIKKQLGDVSIGDSFKVEKVSNTQLRVKSGEAWVKGLPFLMRSGKDHLVSGDILTAGILPNNVSISDDPNGDGKLIDFNSGGTTPSDTYRIVISAEEEVITNTQDPFIKNANITESTAQKLRLVYKINIVPNSTQDSSPLPYTNDASDQNLINEIVVTANGGANGELTNTQVVSGAEEVDGRDLELTITNDPGVGGGNPFPNSSSDQARFSNGKLIDSAGNEYHVNDIFNGTISTNIVIRIDKEVSQVNPTITNGTTYKLIKNDVFKTDPVNGNPEGKLFLDISDVVFDSTDGVVHKSSITDLRKRVIKEEDFQDKVNLKSGLILTDGGLVDFNSGISEVNWGNPFTIINPFGNDNTIPVNTVVILEGGSLVYTLNLVSGGNIDVGNLAVTISSAGTTTTLSGSPDLSLVRIGNIIKDSGGNIAQITDIDNVNDSLTVSPALVSTGAATIYRDSFAPGTAPKNEDSFVLMVRKTDQIWSDSRVLAPRPNTEVPTGLMSPYVGLTSPSGWVLASGKTIGNVSSGATERANDDTQTLFALLWNDYSNTLLPIEDSSGTPTTRGASASLDFIANKRMPVLDARGRVIIGKDDMGGATASRITVAGSGIDGTILGDSGGSQLLSQHNHSTSNDSHTHAGIYANANHTHLQGSYHALMAVFDDHPTHADSFFVKDAASFASWNSTKKIASLTVDEGVVLNTDRGVLIEGESAQPGIGQTSTIASAASGLTIDNTGTGSHGDVQPSLIQTMIIKL